MDNGSNVPVLLILLFMGILCYLVCFLNRISKNTIIFSNFTNFNELNEKVRKMMLLKYQLFFRDHQVKPLFSTTHWGVGLTTDKGIYIIDHYIGPRVLLQKPAKITKVGSIIKMYSPGDKYPYVLMKTFKMKKDCTLGECLKFTFDDMETHDYTLFNWNCQRYSKRLLDEYAIIEKETFQVLDRPQLIKNVLIENTLFHLKETYKRNVLE